MFTGFIGPNGAGKTTTMRIMATIDIPDSGDILFDGVSSVEYPEEARRFLGYMPDSLPEDDDIKVREYIDFFARVYGLKGKLRTENHKAYRGVHRTRGAAGKIHQLAFQGYETAGLFGARACS